MKRDLWFVCWLLLIACGVVVTISSDAIAQSEARPGQTRGVDREAIVELFRERAKTFNERDLEAQLALVDDDIIITTAIGQVTVRGKVNYGGLMLFIWDRGFKDKTLTEEVLAIDFLSEEMALVQLKLSINPSDDFPYDHLNALRLVIKKKGKWLVRSTSHIPYRRQMPLSLKEFEDGIAARKKEVEQRLANEQK